MTPATSLHHDPRNVAEPVSATYLTAALERMRLAVSVFIDLGEPLAKNAAHRLPAFVIVPHADLPWCDVRYSPEGATRAYLDLCDKLLSSASASPAAPPGADEAGDVDPPPASPAAPMVS